MKRDTLASLRLPQDQWRWTSVCWSLDGSASEGNSGSRSAETVVTSHGGVAGTKGDGDEVRHATRGNVDVSQVSQAELSNDSLCTLTDGCVCA